MASKRKRDTRIAARPERASPASTTPKSAPLVFISHDHRDAPLAESFELLIRDASAGFLRTFRSSARVGTTGIEYGREWYKAIMANLQEASELVALITVNSLDRPWILYEAGVAAGRLEVPILGVVLGVPLDKANVGPFAQFQNSSDEEEALTGVLQQLVTRNTSATPRLEAIRIHVQAFRKTLPAVPRSATATTLSRPEDFVPRLFEEIKTMFREISVRLGPSSRLPPGRTLGAFHRLLDQIEQLPPSHRFAHYPRLLDALLFDDPNATAIVAPLSDFGHAEDPSSVGRAQAIVERLLEETPLRMVAADDREEWHHALTHLHDFLQSCRRSRSGGSGKHATAREAKPPRRIAAKRPRTRDGT